jgi:hypothetical protein
MKIWSLDFGLGHVFPGIQAAAGRASDQDHQRETVRLTGNGVLAVIQLRAGVYQAERSGWTEGTADADEVDVPAANSRVGVDRIRSAQSHRDSPTKVQNH